MIPRYTRPEMDRLWAVESRYQVWLDIELLVVEAMAERKTITKDVCRAIQTKAQFNVKRIEILERELKHDVLAFLTCVSEYIGPEARHMHRGLTSSDVLDTALAVLLSRSSDVLLKDIDRLLAILKLRAFEFKDTVCMGRSHGVHGEPITFGLKLALWYEEMRRNRERLVEAKKTISVGKISGAMGTFAHVEPEIEAYVVRKLGLTADPIATQIIQRDRHAHFFSTLAVMGASVEKFATEIRHLQRTEVFEAEELFTSGQKGSSAMPHKRNPIASENLSGLARLLRGYAVSALENVPLWHERDISHSSVERVIAPDATTVLDFMLNRFTQVIEHLVVYPKHMKRNLEKTKGLIYSQRVLLALTDKGCARDEAYRLVQGHSMKVWDGEGDFSELVMGDPKITRYLKADEIKPLFDVSYFLRNVDTLFERVFGK